ncbi:MAG: hypothetical protein HYU35_02235 [Parcubacteria group bacterium]|nr:hypothetical protein [Parcubacteria group bacterium]
MASYYRFAVLDPRPTATEANDKVFASGPVLGVEVTTPALAARCGLGNIDPQHTDGGDASRAAIEVARECELPPRDAVLATVRADLDSVGAMAIISLRRDLAERDRAVENEGGEALADGYTQDGRNVLRWLISRGEFASRVALVATSDKFARGGWPGRRPLPTRESPWDEATATAESSRPLAVIAAAVMDFKVPLADRVATMEQWLLHGDEPARYREAVEAERSDLITALETGQIKVQLAAGERIAVVESTHRAATSVGYSRAPVVVALNPEFRFQGGESLRKFTICAFEAGKFADIKSALAELAVLEPGWGGSPTIGGSPQGVSSTLTTDKVVEVVARNLR